MQDTAMPEWSSGCLGARRTLALCGRDEDGSAEGFRLGRVCQAYQGSGVTGYARASIHSMSRFAGAKGLMILLTVDLQPDHGGSKTRFEEIKTALHEPALSTAVDIIGDQ
jgi:hypothetical protein